MRSVRKGMIIFLIMILLFTTFVQGTVTADSLSGTSSAGSVNQTSQSQHWAQSSIDKWTRLGVVKGYEDGTFHPNQQVTRAELATMINRIFGYTQASGQSFTDVPKDAWYSNALSIAKEAGYYEGFPGNLAKATTSVSRQDAVTLIVKAFYLKSQVDGASKSYSDYDAIRPYAREAIAALSDVLKGYPDGSFKPDKSISRAEVVKVFDSLVSELYSSAGTYNGGKINNHAVISADGVTLKDSDISGNLYLSAGIGNGDATLEKSQIKGITYVAGGGENSIHMNQTTVGDLVVQRPDGKVRIVFSKKSNAGNIIVNSPAILAFDSDSSVNHLTINSGGAGTIIEGAGTISEITVLADGVTVNGQMLTKNTSYVLKQGKLEVVGTKTNTTGTTGNGTSGSGNPVDPVNPENKTIDLVDVNATAETGSLFQYLNEVRGTQVLFGHQHDTTEGLSITAKDGTQSDVLNAVGDLPGVFGWDTLSLEGKEKPGVGLNNKQQNRDNLVAVMKKAYEEGGVVTLSAHMPNFVTGGSFNDTKGKVVSSILPGGEKHEEYNQFLDLIADFANNLKDDDNKQIPVIFRPFHEQNGGWFWWGAPYRTKEQYIELYRYTVEYLRDVKGVNNFLYAYSPNSSFNNSEATYMETYPGDEYVDILGFDSYYNGNSEGWFGGVLQDAKLVSRLADSKGKVAALTEFGYSNLRPSGTNDLHFFTKLLDALKSDPDAKKMAYMMTWANFSTDNFFVPYKNGLNGLGDHELLPDLVNYYNDPYTSFNKEVKTDNIYTKDVEASKKNPYLHIATPTNNETVLIESASLIRARVLHQNTEKVVYLIGSDSVEHPMTIDNSGFYYLASWTPGAALSGLSTTITVKSYAKDGSVIKQTIQVYVNDTLPNSNTLVVDTFENYNGNNELLDNAYSPGGDLSTISLDTEHKNSGQYGLKFAYNVGVQGYTGQTKNMDNVNWSEANQLKFWYEPDGSNQKLVVQIKMSGISFEAYPSLAGQTAGEIAIPFSEFKPAPWDTANAGQVITKKYLKDVQTFSIFVNKSSSVAATTGTLYFDDIQAFNDGTGGVPDGGTAAGPQLLYGFETDTEGWTIESNTASAEPVTVTSEASTEGAQALFVAFSLAGTEFELTKNVTLDLSAVDTLSAKVKLSNGTAKARLYIKTGSNWTWTDSGPFDVDSTAFTTLSLPLAGISDLSQVRVIGVKFDSFSGSGNTAAYLDEVRISSDSVIPENPNTIKFEAESGTLNGGVTVSTESGGFSGTGYVTGFKTSGDTLQIPVNLERAGTYMLAIHYKTIGGSKVNTVKLNGTTLANYTFAEAGVWKDAVLGQYDFKAGANTIEIATSWGWMDIDYIQLTGGGGPVTSVNLKSSGASGAVDIPVTLYALADNSAEYRFLARKAGGEWEYVNNYSKNYSYVWAAPGSGEYELKAYARQIGSTAEFDAESAILDYTALPDYTGKPLVNPIFSSQMVLQRDKEVSIWGWAEPGTEISVKLDATAFTGTADANGNWNVPIGVNQTGDSHTITVTGAGQTVTLTDVLFGDVYLTSGQSNMAFPMSQVTNAATEISNANNPNIRFFTVPQLTSRYPVSMVTSEKKWQVASPETVPGLTAVGYFYAKKLTEETGVPVGIIFSAVGGTKIENWTSYETLESMPSLAQAALDIKSGAANIDTATSPTALYNGMIAPVAPYTLKGVLWYQGSANWGEARYYKALPTLIKDWRQTFGDDQLPFTIVQLAAFGTLQSVDNPAQPDTNLGQPIVRDAQLQTVLNDPLTSLVVTTDVGTPGDIHPTNKRDVGERAAISALGKIYNKPIEYSGPIYQSMEKSGNKLILSFDHAGSGLMAGVKVDLVPVTEDTNGLKGFAIAGADGVYHWADAQIVGDTVVVSSEQVSAPVTVKYNWNDSPIGNLYNKDGLPASPFRTDNVSYLSVFGGSGSGFHTPGEAVTIKAPSKAGKKFDKWVGDIGAIADPLSSNTTLVMPNEHFTEVGATYADSSEQPDSIMAYAKDAVLTGAGASFSKTPVSPDTEYAGDGYIWFSGDGTADFTLNIPSNGEYELSFGYYIPNGSKHTSVSINGGASSDITIPDTQGKVAGFSLGKQQLTAGANVVSFAKGWGYYGIEYVKAVAVTETVPNNTIEAESGILTGTTTVATSIGGYSGDGYVAFKNDGSITLTYDAKAAGNYDLVLGYSSPYGDKKTQLTINSGAAVELNLASSGFFTESEAIPVNLVQGSNTILINSGWGYYNLDYIRLTPSVVVENPNIIKFEAESGTLNGGVTVSTESGGFSGTGYVTGFKTSGDTLQIPVNLERAGTYMLAIHYKTAGGSKVNPVSLNGTRIANYNFAETSIWKDAILGQYDFTAGANTIDIGTAWGWMDIDYIQLTGGGGSVTSVNLNSAAGASGAVDTPVTLYALANNSAEYRFLARKAGGEWEYVNNYSKNYSYSWKVPEQGEYELKAYARQIGSTAEFDAESAILKYTALPDYTSKPLVNPMFSSHMVLQRDKDVAIWGWADPGTGISVKLDNTTFSGIADSNGNWKVSIGVNQTGAPHTITVTGAGKNATFTDVLFGDVYLTSGQSNMAFPMSKVTNSATEISNANNPNIRFFTVPQLTSRSPVSMVTSQKQWQVASPDTVPGLTAVGYFFAKKLTEETGVPVGIIFSAVGGTKIENWTSCETLETMPSLAQAALDIKSGAANIDTATSPTVLYNGMIAPVAPYKLKGVLWYQGSANWGEYRYYNALPALIKNWRQTFDDEQLPFTILQLAAYGALQSIDNPAQLENNPGETVIRDAQLQTVLNDPLTSLVVTTDVGTPEDIHPTNKQDVGERAAISVLGKFYNKSIEYSGPIYRSVEKSGNKLILSFDHTGSGLMAGVKVDLVPVTEDLNGLKGFAIAGADGVYHWADAQIVGDTVVVSSEQVSDPVTVKYNWNDSPIGNLYNKDGLPASPFRTDKVYYLSVFGGSGSGPLTPGEAVTIKSPTKVGKKFDKWIGDIGAIANPFASSTTLVMPNKYFTEVASTFVEDDGQTDSLMAYAKDAILNGASFKKVPTSPDTEYSGDGYVWFGGTDGTADFTLTVPSDGEYELSFGYYNPYVVNKKTSVSINGGAYSDITIPNNEGKVAEYSLGKLQLVAGVNVISFAKGWGYYGIEYVKAVAVTKTVPNNTIEAESGTLTGTAAVATSVGGYSGDGYVAFKSDGSITLNYDAETAGNYDLVLGYSSPNGDKKTQLVINGGAAVNVDLASSSSFTDREAIPVSLVQGLNTILINSGWGYYNIDYVKLTPSEEVVEPSFPSLVYGFEDQTLQGFALNTASNNQYNTALATNLSVTNAVYAQGNYSIKADFSLVAGGGLFQIRHVGQTDLSGASTITAKVKIVPSDEGTSLAGVRVHLFAQSGESWQGWTISDPFTTQSAVDENGFMTVSLDISSLTTLNFMKAFGLQVRTLSGPTGQATIYVDEITIK
ncbi:CBM35 domain-containing protein [Paenibacillus sp. sgz500992]|uniref:CBM35 domain-containing protein n=1 Tax=Paenibacillus sp. sgz500992 TaxID=3242476 RepID=UPI0036D42D11